MNEKKQNRVQDLRSYQREVYIHLIILELNANQTLTQQSPPKSPSPTNTIHNKATQSLPQHLPEQTREAQMAFSSKVQPHRKKKKKKKKEMEPWKN